MSEDYRLQKQIDTFLERKARQHPDLDHYVDHIGRL
jgi:hypothetical protein